MIMRHVSLSFHNLCAGEEYTAASDISAGVSSASDATAPATTLADISTGDATATSPRASAAAGEATGSASRHGAQSRLRAPTCGRGA